MTQDENRDLMERIFAGLSEGDDSLFVKSMAEEMKWKWMGSGDLSHTFDGKQAILDQLWASVRRTLVPPYKVHASRFIAGEDHVVVEAIGENQTPSGQEYRNQYCWVCRLSEGKIQELREYMDTQLVTETFTASGTDGSE
jgi:ketosteroid isomerase-like protein